MKKLLSLLCIVFMLAALSACSSFGSSQEGDTPSETLAMARNAFSGIAPSTPLSISERILTRDLKILEIWVVTSLAETDKALDISSQIGGVLADISFEAWCDYDSAYVYMYIRGVGMQTVAEVDMTTRTMRSAQLEGA